MEDGRFDEEVRHRGGPLTSQTEKETAKRAADQSLRQLLKDPQYRRKLWLTVGLAVAFFSIGLHSGMNGATLLDLRIITDTGLEQSAAFLTGGSFGYLSGSAAAGVFHKISGNIRLFVASFAIGVVTVSAPYCSIYVLMIVNRVIAGFCAGVVDTAGNAEHMRIWGNEGQVLMQLLHFCFAFGGVMAPLYAEPFLAERPNETEAANSTAGNYTDIDDLSQRPRTTDVLYAFVITSIFMFVASIPFLWLILKGVKKTKRETKKAHDKVNGRKLPRPLYLFLLCLLCSFYTLYCSVEEQFKALLMTFLVNQYDFMSKSRAAHMSAVYWASFATSRFLMIFLSKLLSAVRLLYLCCTLMLLAYTCFLICASLGAVDALPVFVAMAGLSMSAVFPAGFSYTEAELFKVTGRVSACILVSACLGNIFNPLVLGYLMEEVSNMWFCYFMVILTLIMCAIFTSLLLFNRCYVNKRYGLVSSLFLENSVKVSTPESEQPLNPIPI